MVKNEIKMKTESCDVFDKKQIALAIRNSTYGDELKCSLKDEGILKSCECCSLKNICEKIDDIAEEYIKNTSSVVNEFSFE